MSLTVLAVDDSRTMRDMIRLALGSAGFEVHVAEDGEAGLDGDLVAVHRTPDVRNGQVVVARLEDEVTVKRYRQVGKIVWLLPHNPDFEPIKVDLDAEHLMIEGVVVGVIRSSLATASMG